MYKHASHPAFPFAGILFIASIVFLILSCQPTIAYPGDRSHATSSPGHNLMTKWHNQMSEKTNFRFIAVVLAILSVTSIIMVGKD